MAYVVIRAGGKQYRVAEGDKLRVETLPGDVGQDVEFKDIVMAERDGKVIVEPKALAQMKVTAKIVRHGRGAKVMTLKFARRKGYQLRKGHRQNFTEVKIASIG